MKYDDGNRSKRTQIQSNIFYNYWWFTINNSIKRIIVIWKQKVQSSQPLIFLPALRLTWYIPIHNSIFTNHLLPVTSKRHHCWGQSRWTTDVHNGFDIRLKILSKWCIAPTVTANLSFVVTDIICPGTFVVSEFICKRPGYTVIEMTTSERACFAAPIIEQNVLQLVELTGWDLDWDIHDSPQHGIGTRRLSQWSCVAPEMNRFLDVGVEWVPVLKLRLLPARSVSQSSLRAVSAFNGRTVRIRIFVFGAKLTVFVIKVLKLFDQQL